VEPDHDEPPAQPVSVTPLEHAVRRMGGVGPRAHRVGEEGRLDHATQCARAAVISLRARLARGVVRGDLTDPSLDVPSTATVAAGRLWAVNLRFTTPPGPTTPYWITQLPLRP
jgi:hypothetical protein